jgi:hypothetical protein
MIRLWHGQLRAWDGPLRARSTPDHHRPWVAQAHSPGSVSETLCSAVRSC